MRETSRAQQAWNDYLNMGPARSLEKLAAEYRNRTDSVPTQQVSRLKFWSQQHGWQARLAEIAEAERSAIVARGIADRQNRVEALNDRWNRMREIVRARSEAMSDVIEGGDTGLLVRQWKRIGSGKNAETVEEYAVDAGLLSEMRAHEKQAAQELGQWDQPGGTGQTLTREYVGIDPTNV